VVATRSIPFRQRTENCFSDAIGPGGLDPVAFGREIERLAPALDRLRRAHGGGTMALLRLATAHDDLAALGAVARHLRQDFDHVIVLGTGGSSLGGQALCALARPIGGGVGTGHVPRFVENIDPDSFQCLLKARDPARTAVIVVSKSGATAETLFQFLACLAAFAEKLGDWRAASHFVVVTEPGDNPLRRLAAAHGMTILDHDPNIGGRFSVLSLVGLLPALVAGLDAAAVRDGAAAVLDATLAASNPGDSGPAVGAAIAVGLMREKAIAQTVLMPYADRLGPFARWFRQLWAESLGKKGRGMTPLAALGAVDQHSQLQLYLDGPRDKMFTLVTLARAGVGPRIPPELVGDDRLRYLAGRSMGDLMAAEQRATAEALAGNGRPLRCFELQTLDERALGALMMHFMLETVFAAHLMDVDPFDQPAVEEGKERARRYLGEMEPK